MKTRYLLIARVVFAVLFAVGLMFICNRRAHADATTEPFVPKESQGEQYKNYLDELERETDAIEAETSLRSLELSLYEQLLRKQAELRRLEREISAMRQASIEAAIPPAERAIEELPAPVVPHEAVTEEFVSILPDDVKPGKGEVLVALVHLRRGEVKEVRVLDESADSILAEVPFGKISIRKSAIDSIKARVYPKEEYRFKLGDYYDNVPSSRSYYTAIAQYNKVLDINPNNQRAKDKLEQCRQELEKILERERAHERRIMERSMPPPEPGSSPPAAPQRPVQYDVSQQPMPLEIFCYHVPVVPGPAMAPHSGRVRRPYMFGSHPRGVPLDVNGSVWLVPCF
jgi:hypothetical protein